MSALVERRCPVCGELQWRAKRGAELLDALDRAGLPADACARCAATVLIAAGIETLEAAE